MHIVEPVRLKSRRLAPAVMAALVATALAVPVADAAESPITVDAARDSAQVTGLPFGRATLQVTRPDLKTGKPVVIGQYQGLAAFGQPFGVNTTAPSLLNPAGDCWQKGALSLKDNLGLTPDILPGDTVSVAGGPSLTVPAQTATPSGVKGGPIDGCDKLSLWGRNELTTAEFASAGGDLAVSGHAQPGAKGVSVTATDSNGVSADPVAATMAADGRFTATIPADTLAKLADGPLTLAADYTVPDVATGKMADIGGVTLSVDKETPAAPEPAPSQPAPQAPTPAPAAPPKIALHGLVTKRKISLRSLEAGKLRASFIVPTGAKYVRVRLSQNGNTKARVVAPAAAAGTRQTVALTGVSKAKRGLYTITVLASRVNYMFVGDVLRASVRVR